MEAFVLGLDDTTFDILDPLMEDGSLPNINRMISEGPSAFMQLMAIHNN